MKQTSEYPAQGEPNIGDRVRIQEDPRGILNLVGQVGTIVEIFRVPLDSCLVRIDGDPNPQRTWMLYRNEFVVLGERSEA